MEEQLRILKMLEEGKITAEQASEFLTALTPQKETEAASYEVAETERVNLEYDKRMVCIVVDSSEGDKVNVQAPGNSHPPDLKSDRKAPAVSESLQGIELTGDSGYRCGLLRC